MCSNGRRAQFCRQHKALFTVVVNLVFNSSPYCCHLTLDRKGTFRSAFVSFQQQNCDIFYFENGVLTQVFQKTGVIVIPLPVL